MRYSRLGFYTPFTAYPYTGEAVPCPGCCADDSWRLGRLDRRFKRLPTVACGRCGLLYTNPMPTDAELDAYYGQFYRLDYQAAGSGPTARHLRKRRHEALYRANHLEGLVAAEASTLDFGCGSGEFVGLMVEEGRDGHGFEPGELYGNHAKALLGERIKVDGWRQVSYLRTFDLVTCFHVLEHLRDPMAALAQMAAWSAPGGLVYVEVPDLGNMHPNKGFGALHFAHVLGFNHHSLVVAAARAGLRPRKVVSPTGIIFEHGALADEEAEARKGHELTRQIYGDGRIYSNYLSYQIGKLTGANRRQRNPR